MNRRIGWPRYDKFPMPLTNKAPLVYAIIDEGGTGYATIDEGGTGYALAAADLTMDELDTAYGLTEGWICSNEKYEEKAERLRYEHAFLFVLRNEIERRKAQGHHSNVL